MPTLSPTQANPLFQAERTPTHQHSQDLHPRCLCTLHKHYQQSLEGLPNVSSAEDRWNYIREATYDLAMGRFSKKERQSRDWFEAGIAELEPAIEAKRTALLNYKREPWEKTQE